MVWRDNPSVLACMISVALSRWKLEGVGQRGRHRPEKYKGRYSKGYEMHFLKAPERWIYHEAKLMKYIYIYPYSLFLFHFMQTSDFFFP